jgi:tetratricopeptide (TPR) repeat protein
MSSIPRYVSRAVIAIMLPSIAMSCSEARTPDGSAKSEPDKAVLDDPETIRRNKAIADYTEAIRLNPKDADSRGVLAYVNRGGVFAEKGEHDKANADFTEAIRLYPIMNAPFLNARMIEAYDARATSYQKKGDYDKAIADNTEVIRFGTASFKDIGEAMAFGGMSADAHYKRGVCYDEKGEHAKAVADYEEAVRLAPNLMKNEDLKRRMGK